MKTLITTLIVILAYSSMAQTIKYKKEVRPLILSKDYSAQARHLVLRFHGQNTNPDGSLTEKSLMFGYDNVRSARVYLGNAYGKMGVKTKKLDFLDSSVYYIELAGEMVDAPDNSGFIKYIKNKKAEILKAIEDEKKAAQEAIYGEKIDTVVYDWATSQDSQEEFMEGPFTTRFISLSGDSINLQNADLEEFAQPGKSWVILESIRPSKFILTYKFVDIPADEFSLDGGGYSTDVLVSIELADPDSARKLCQLEIIEYLNELNAEFGGVLNIESQTTWIYNQVYDIKSCTEYRASLRGIIERELGYAKEKEAKIKAIQDEQRRLRASVSCPTCPESVAKKFIQAALAFSESGLRKVTSKCGCSNSKEQSLQNCKNYQGYPGPTYRKIFYIEKFMSNRNYVSEFKRLKSSSGVYETHFINKTRAVVHKPRTDGKRVAAIFLALENSSWKVIAVDEFERL